MKKKILIGLGLVLLVIQFARPARNLSGDDTNHLATKYSFPGNVAPLIEKACYDCHSNKTVYPWYSNIQPVGWWLANHVNEGKEHLNFSEFATYVHGTKCAAQFSGNVHVGTVRRYRDQRIAKDNIEWEAPKEELTAWQAEWAALLDAIRQDRPHNEARRAAEDPRGAHRGAVHLGGGGAARRCTSGVSATSASPTATGSPDHWPGCSGCSGSWTWRT